MGLHFLKYSWFSERVSYCLGLCLFKSIGFWHERMCCRCKTNISIYFIAQSFNRKMVLDHETRIILKIVLLYFTHYNIASTLFWKIPNYHFLLSDPHSSSPPCTTFSKKNWIRFGEAMWLPQLLWEELNSSNLYTTISGFCKCMSYFSPGL